jgi:hypothetical protein
VSLLPTLTFSSNIWCILEKVPCALKRMYTVQLLDGILCTGLSCLFILWCHSFLEFCCWFFCLDLSIGDRVLKSLTTTVLGSVCLFKSSNICLMRLGTLTLGPYKLKFLFSLDIFFVLLVWTNVFCLFWQFKFEVYIIWFKCATPAYF